MAAEWLSREPMRGFPHPVSLAEAYRWQDRFAAELAPTLGSVVGYKTGGHDSGPHFRWFPLEGIRGQILEGMLRPSGTAIRPGDTRVGFLEADLAFRVGSEAINTAQSDLEILAALDALVPFAEIPDPWYDPRSRSIEGTIVANMSTRYSFTGEAVPLQASRDWLARLRQCEVVVRNEHGDIVQQRSLRDWYEPIAVVRWLRDQLLATGHRLEVGQLLSLGNAGIVRALHSGTARGPAYPHNLFRLEYQGLVDGPAPFVAIAIHRP